MGLLGSVWSYMLQHSDRLGAETARHLQYAVVALAIALVICVPLGVLASRNRLASLVVINLFGTARVVPSIAILFLALPFLGLGFTPALIALTVLACPPILINTSAGFSGVDPAVIESARGMGMSPSQILWRIESPLALPVLLAGVRIATVEVIASATLATFIGGGGLGDFIAEGFSTLNTTLLLVGAIPVALIALCAQLLLSGLQRVLSPAT